MRLRRKAALLREAALESLTLAVEIFNRPSEVGRTQGVLIMGAHAFEMLLKAVIYQERRTIRVPRARYTYSFEKCISICRDDLNVLSQDAATVLLTLKHDRDAAAHDHVAMIDEMLWIHVRSMVTVFDAVLQAAFEEGLADVLPSRVIPVAAQPPTDAHLVVEKEIEHIQSLLAPGTRRSAEARSHLRPLLALDGSLSGRQEPPSEIELGRAERALRAGRAWEAVFPGLAQLEIAPYGDFGDVTRITFRVGRDPEGIPVRIAEPGEEDQALTYREINYFDKYNIKLSKFGEKLGLTRNQGLAIIYTLNLKDNPDFYYRRLTARGNVLFQGLSRAALHRAREALDRGEITVDEAVARYRNRGA